MQCTYKIHTRHSATPVLSDICKTITTVQGTVGQVFCRPDYLSVESSRGLQVCCIFGRGREVALGATRSARPFGYLAWILNSILKVFLKL